MWFCWLRHLSNAFFKQFHHINLKSMCNSCPVGYVYFIFHQIGILLQGNYFYYATCIHVYIIVFYSLQVFIEVMCQGSWVFDPVFSVPVHCLFSICSLFWFHYVLALLSASLVGLCSAVLSPVSNRDHHSACVFKFLTFISSVSCHWCCLSRVCFQFSQSV